MGRRLRILNENIFPSTLQTIDVKMMVIRELAKGWVFHLLLSNLT